jgi:hypothetical protein
LNDPRALRTALREYMAREAEQRWAVVSISSRQAQDSAVAMVIFEGSRDACSRIADVLPAGGYDMPGVEHSLSIIPQAEWDHPNAAVTAGEAG